MRSGSPVTIVEDPLLLDPDPGFLVNPNPYPDFYVKKLKKFTVQKIQKILAF
jgi:hypothetical protein